MSELRLFFRLFVYIFVPLMVGYLTWEGLHTVLFEPVNPSDRSEKLILVEPGMDFSQVTERVRSEGVVRSSQSLRLLALFQGIKEEIIPGEYVLSPSMTPKEILQAFVQGRVHTRDITLTPGISVWDVGKILEEAGLVKDQEFTAAITSPGLLARAGISAESFEGYLYPDTYQFSRPIDAEQVIWGMLERGEKHWPPKYSDKADELKRSRHEILTLASLIEKEALQAHEKTIISSVFHNRLNEGMKLESEQSIIYGIRDFSGSLTPEDYTSPSPYNTFLNHGLPPGPICNPDDSSIHAALFPEKTSYLFFLRDTTGGHVFSETQKEHEEAKLSFQPLQVEPADPESAP